MTRPVVLVTSATRGSTVQWLATALAIRRAGGRAVRVTPELPPPVNFDALIIGGGADLDESRYSVLDAWRVADPAKASQPEEPQTRLIAAGFHLLRKTFGAKPGPDRARDVLETKLFAVARERKRPVLGICRGAQLINVALGGSLVEDVEAFYFEVPHMRTVLPRRPVDIEPSSRLAETLGPQRTWVNALHHQAVAELGEGLRVVARDDNGIVQGIEHETSCILGVQWHPELIPQHRRQQRLFSSLVAQANRARQSTQTMNATAQASFQ